MTFLRKPLSLGGVLLISSVSTLACSTEPTMVLLRGTDTTDGAGSAGLDESPAASQTLDAAGGAESGSGGSSSSSSGGSTGSGMGSMPGAGSTSSAGSTSAAGAATGAGTTLGLGAMAGEAGAAGAGGEGGAEISSLTIEPNPRMSLSCIVSWQTAEPSNSVVRFGVQGAEFEIRDEAQVTDHRIHVVGMHAETTYALEVNSTGPSGTASESGTFTTGALPPEIAAGGTLITSQPDQIAPGWTLTNVTVTNDFGGLTGVVVMLDEAGIPVWYFVNGKAPNQHGALSTDWLPNGHVLLGPATPEPPREVDLEGVVRWTGLTLSGPARTHDIAKLPSGNYLMFRETAGSAWVQEIAPDNRVVWNFDLYDHIGATVADGCHLNAVSVDSQGGVYLNCRWRGLFKIDRASDAVLWQMGAAIDDPNSGDITYLPDLASKFNDSHDPQIHDDGTILFYDNQGWTKHGGAGSYHSRVVEYALDAQTKEATLAWEFPGDFSVDPWYTSSWYSHVMGGTQRLPNGNVLVCAPRKGVGLRTRIFEVTRTGEVVWAFEWPEDVGAYRASRFQPPVSRIAPPEVSD